MSSNSFKSRCFSLFQPLLFFLSRGNTSQKRKRRFIALSVLLVVLSPAMLIGAASSLRVKAPAGQVPTTSFPSVPGITTDIEMFLEAISIDPITRIMVVDWFPRFSTSAVNCSEYLTKPKIREFHIPSVLMDKSSPETDLAGPIFVLNSTAYCMDTATTAFGSFRSFTKVLTFRESFYFPAKGSPVSSLQNYPFDRYLAPLAISIRDPDSGRSDAPVISQFVGTVVNFEIVLAQSYVESNRAGGNELAFYFMIKRSKAVQGFVVIAAITNWLAGTAFLVIVAAALVYPPHQIYAEMFVVPIGALFAFSSIRANLPGAPDGFGTTLDMYSILPVLIVMAFCSFSLLLIVLYRRITQIAGATNCGAGVFDIESGGQKIEAVSNAVNMQLGRESTDIQDDKPE